MTTTSIPVIVLALAASFAASVSLGSVSAGTTEMFPAPVQAGDTPPDPHAPACRIANAFPTAEAGFAIRRPVVARR